MMTLINFLELKRIQITEGWKLQNNLREEKAKKLDIKQKIISGLRNCENNKRAKKLLRNLKSINQKIRFLENRNREIPVLQAYKIACNKLKGY